MSYHACVCGLFHSYMCLHCVSVFPVPSECCVGVVVCGLLLFFPLSTVLIHVIPNPTNLHLGKLTHRNVIRQKKKKKEEAAKYMQVLNSVYICVFILILKQ